MTKSTRRSRFHQHPQAPNQCENRSLEELNIGTCPPPQQEEKLHVGAHGCARGRDRLVLSVSPTHSTLVEGNGIKIKKLGEIKKGFTWNL